MAGQVCTGWQLHALGGVAHWLRYSCAAKGTRGRWHVLSPFVSGYGWVRTHKLQLRTSAWSWGFRMEKRGGAVMISMIMHLTKCGLFVVGSCEDAPAVGLGGFNEDGLGVFFNVSGDLEGRCGELGGFDVDRGVFSMWMALVHRRC